MSEHDLTNHELTALRNDYRAFASQFQSLLLATADSDALPEASYAPYLYADGYYYIYISDLARHTANLRHNPHCSILFIETEADAKQLFARRRLSFSCNAEFIARDSDSFNFWMEALIERFGAFMAMLKNLTDFQLVRLRPIRGNYVAGFAKAYEISGEQLEHLRWRQEKATNTTNSTEF